MNKSQYQKIAAAWRRNQAQTDSQARSGVVLISNSGEPYGWKNALRDPSHEMPGSVAVDAAGRVYVARGGDEYHGARKWELLAPEASPSP